MPKPAEGEPFLNMVADTIARAVKILTEGASAEEEKMAQDRGHENADAEALEFIQCEWADFLLDMILDALPPEEYVEKVLALRQKRLEAEKKPPAVSGIKIVAPNWKGRQKKTIRPQADKLHLCIGDSHVVLQV
jgi:hypothetical protein